MKLLIAVKSCIRDLLAGHHDAIRETWGKDFEGLADVRFFTGSGGPFTLKDETRLDVNDDYDSLPFKARAICDWMLGTVWTMNIPYTHVFLCDNDTFVKPSLLMASGFEKYDYSGLFNIGEPRSGRTFPYIDEKNNVIDKCYPWASGGYGYFLSQKAATEVAMSYPLSWAEDLSVGMILGPLVAKRKLSADRIDIASKATWHIFKTAKYPVTTPEAIREFAKFENPADFYKVNR